MKAVMALIFALTTSPLLAQVKTFDEIWQDFYKKSLLIQEARDEKESDTLALKRANRHWYPRAFISAQIFSTDDPGQVFFNNLGQRSITPLDFNPPALNNPERETFKTGAIGVQLPLYEGGSKVAQLSMFELLLEARELEIEARKTQEYAELSRQYGEMLISSNGVFNLAGLDDELSKVMSTYQVGAKSNPVGYSGLLGLKAIHNRIVALTAKFRLDIENKKNWINEKADIHSNWSHDQHADIKTYIEKNLQFEVAGQSSRALLGHTLQVNALGEMRRIERGRFLPQVGLFAQNNLYSGSRDLQNAQVYGVTLTWDIFNSDSYGKVAEAQAKLNAAQAKIGAARQDESIARNNLLSSKKVLEENLKLLEDTEKLLAEQGHNAMKLFKSGLLSALQLSEVINRRVDLIDNKSNVEKQYLEVMSNIYELGH